MPKGPWVIERDDDCPTECEDAHPVRLGSNPQHQPREPYERTSAIIQGRKGYMCPGGVEHTYSVWVVFNTVTEQQYDTFTQYRLAVQARDRLNQEVQSA